MDLELDLVVSSSSEFSSSDDESTKKETQVPTKTPKIRAPTPVMDEKPINIFIDLLTKLSKAQKRLQEESVD